MASPVGSIASAYFRAAAVRTHGLLEQMPSGSHGSIRTLSRQAARRISVALSLVVGLIASAHSSAQTYSARKTGEWMVTASADASGCFLTREYPGDGGTILLFGLAVNNTNHLSVLNDDWSIRPKVPVVLDFRLSNRRYVGQLAVGIESNGKRGFVTGFQPRFPADLAASKFLYIDRGAIPVARLSLDGGGPAVAELRKCVAASKVDVTSKSLADTDVLQVPRDPFSSELEEPRREARARARSRAMRRNR